MPAYDEMIDDAHQFVDESDWLETGVGNKPQMIYVSRRDPLQPRQNPPDQAS